MTEQETQFHLNHASSELALRSVINALFTTLVERGALKPGDIDTIFDDALSALERAEHVAPITIGMARQNVESMAVSLSPNGRRLKRRG